ncbi:MAG: hypothetical protein IT385_09145 [Deltaproteobacteria bacterium]|nr:hypothetical protein [Deltaproteobacteria bacterium]
MTNPTDFDAQGPTDDPQVLQESLEQAAAMLEDVLDQVAEAAYVIGAPRGLLPTADDGGVEFDEADLLKTGHPTLVAIAKIAEAIYAALETLPPAPESEDDEDEDEDDEGEDEK